jgi:hypothetical protein
MILTIPYHPRIADYEKLRITIRKLGTNPNHTLCVVSTREHEEAAFEFLMDLGGSFLRQFAVVVPDAAETPVHLSNRLFLASMKALREYTPSVQENPRPAMLYFDPTWMPVTSRWLDELQTGYYLSGAPQVFGYFKLRDDGSPLPTGPIAFAKTYPEQSKLLDFILDSGKHWRDYLSWETFNIAVKTDAIGPTKAACIRPQPVKK